MKDNKGFSLVEIIVIIAVIAVIVGITVPQYIGYVTRAKEAVAKEEVYNLVRTGNVCLLENEMEKKYSFAFTKTPVEATEEFLEETSDCINPVGMISSYKVAMSAVTYVKYTSPNGVTVVYDINKSPMISVESHGNTAEITLTTYYDMAKGILDLNDYEESMSVSEVTNDIQLKYAESNGGKHPRYLNCPAGEKVTSLIQAKGLTYHKDNDDSFLRWIPSSNDDKSDIIMYAGHVANYETSGNIYGAIAYYDSNYYYHTEEETPNQISEVYVGDSGRDTLTFNKLKSLPENTEIDGWKMFSK